MGNVYSLAPLFSASITIVAEGKIGREGSSDKAGLSVESKGQGNEISVCDLKERERLRGEHPCLGSPFIP